MAIQFKALAGPDFGTSNWLRAKATEQIGQGLAQGQQAFQQFNTGLTNRATEEGLANIQALGSRADVNATPLSSITPQYADQAKLRQAYEANKTKQQNIYEDNMLQSGLERIQGIKSLEDYGKTSADQILSQFGQNLSAAKRNRLLGAYEGRDEAIKQQMTADYQFEQQQQAIADKPAVDALNAAIAGSNINNIGQIQNQIQQANISDSAKASLLSKAEQQAVTSQNLLSAQRSEAGYQAQQNLYKIGRENIQQNQKAFATLQDEAAKAGIKLNPNGTLDTSNLSDTDAQWVSIKFQPILDKFQESTKTTQEFNDYLTRFQGVTGYSPDMLNQAKASYKELQTNRDKLTPELQAQYDYDMSIYKQGIDSQVNTLNMRKAAVAQQYQDVANVTSEQLSMTLGDANQAARKALQAQGMDIDAGDMEDLMGTLTKVLKDEDPYILTEVAKSLPIIEGFMFGDADYGWFQKSNVKAKLDEVVKDARTRQNRAEESLNALEAYDNQIIDLNSSIIEKGNELTGKLRILNPTGSRKLFGK